LNGSGGALRYSMRSAGLNLDIQNTVLVIVIATIAM
jgi:hypothetical protein